MQKRLYELNAMGCGNNEDFYHNGGLIFLKNIAILKICFGDINHLYVDIHPTKTSLKI